MNLYDRSQANLRVVIVSTSHGPSPSRARFDRAAELGRACVSSGADVEHVVLQEQLFSEVDRDGLRLLSNTGGLTLIQDPTVNSATARILRSVGERFEWLSTLARPGCPSALVAAVHSILAWKRIDLVIVRGQRLVPLGRAISHLTKVVLDVDRWHPEVIEQARKIGREDVVEFGTWTTGEGLEHFDGVITSNESDRRHVIDHGFEKTVQVVSPSFSLADVRSNPQRPTHVLMVASPTIDNLDAIRWFRRRVLPFVLRSVPTCRFRIVGEAGLQVEPGAEVERTGWIDDLDKEYREASLVVLPTRFGACQRRRVIEAIGHGKAIAVTEEAAYGLNLRDDVDGVVSSDERRFARGIVEILTNDSKREEFEAMSRQRAAAGAESTLQLREFLDPEFASPAEERAPATPREPVAVRSEHFEDEISNERYSAARTLPEESVPEAIAETEVHESIS